MIDDKLKFVFTHIPKTGGTSIEFALVGEARTRAMHGKPLKIQHGTPAEWKYPDAWNKGYFRFSFVRNPFDRVVSSFCYDVEKFNEGNSAFPERRRVVNAMRDDFSGFVVNHLRDFATRDDSEGRLLWPQTRFIDGFNFDFIGRFESLSTDFKQVCHHLGVERPDLPHVNKSERTHYVTYYDADAKRVIEDVYGSDFDRFGYTFEDAQA